MARNAAAAAAATIAAALARSLACNLCTRLWSIPSAIEHLLKMHTDGRTNLPPLPGFCERLPTRFLLQQHAEMQTKPLRQQGAPLGSRVTARVLNCHLTMLELDDVITVTVACGI